MNIAVCIKQVPAYSDGNMDEKTGLLIRVGLESRINIYDLAALETALRIKEQAESRIDVYTMGPESARQALTESYALGVDRGFLICDRAFAGADVLSTSYTLMQAIQSQGSYDLILCGQQTTDGDTGQVSGALAKWLELPRYSGVKKIDIMGKGVARITQDMGDRVLHWEIKGPCLFAVDRHIYTPRMPTLKLRMLAKRKEITIITLKDLGDQDIQHYGLKGSATSVKKIFPPKRTRKQKVQKLEAKAAAKLILETILKDQVAE
ncbi:MAG: electron transfer flavoprotein subunit beta/FixA family protein [Lachnospiraceae bacterium]